MTQLWTLIQLLENASWREVNELYKAKVLDRVVYEAFCHIWHWSGITQFRTGLCKEFAHYFDLPDDTQELIHLYYMKRAGLDEDEKLS